MSNSHNEQHPQGQSTTDGISIDAKRLNEIFYQQKKAYQRHPYPNLNQRLQRLENLKKILYKYQDDFAQAISQDYGNRSIDETKIGEVLTAIENCNYYIKNLDDLMKVSKRSVATIHQPAKAWVEYQPLGVVGIIAPWNYPLFLSLSPLICTLAAGNHAIIKLSSLSKNFAKVLSKALSEAFPDDVVSVVFGETLNDHFTHLPFDKIIFTGSGDVGKKVMRAAAENLTPVLLELGGKSPTIVHEDMPLEDAAQRIAIGKLWNAGQTCVAPDYLFLPRGKTQDFIQAYKAQVQQLYPSIADNPDYTSIVSEKHYQRLQDYLTDAKAQGAEVIDLYPEQNQALLKEKHTISPTLVRHVSPDMLLMKEEIFGPILPIMEYDDIDDVIMFINARPHPLALYYFDFDNKDVAEYIRRNTHSGHFGWNQVLTHVAQEDLPFGGVGASGMGKYHGEEGFYSLSHARSVMSYSKFYALKYIAPPFSRKIHEIVYKTLLRKS
ncbi:MULTISPECIES: coniferyl aldehyde dehydrogenase [unclassified Acinetobacter]|uniref:coniferyl aldehyde dehydrogenase n=1 Tax=unclassified Acinetobacter TaxID=196816 RepID=UPI0035BA854E